MITFITFVLAVSPKISHAFAAKGTWIMSISKFRRAQSLRPMKRWSQLHPGGNRSVLYQHCRPLPPGWGMPGMRACVRATSLCLPPSYGGRLELKS